MKPRVASRRRSAVRNGKLLSRECMGEQISTAGSVMPRIMDIFQRPVDGFTRAYAIYLGRGTVSLAESLDR